MHDWLFNGTIGAEVFGQYSQAIAQVDMRNPLFFCQGYLMPARSAHSNLGVPPPQDLPGVRISNMDRG